MDKTIGLLALGGLAFWALKGRKPAPAPSSGNGPTYYTSPRAMVGLTSILAGSGQIQDGLGVPPVHEPGNNFAGRLVLPANSMRVAVGRFWPTADPRG